MSEKAAVHAPIASPSDTIAANDSTASSSQEAEAEPEIAPQRLDPRQKFDVSARFAQEQAASELARRLCERGLTREARGHELVGACLDVKALLVLEIVDRVGQTARRWRAVTTRT